MHIIREKLEIPVNRDFSELIWDTLSRSYQPLIHQIRGSLRKQLGLERMDPRAFYGGEIFFTSHGQLLYYHIGQDSSGIEAGTLFENDGEQTFSGFKEIITDCAGDMADFHPPWKSVELMNSQFELIRRDCQLLNSEPAHTDAAFMLREDRMREVLSRVHKNSPCFQEELTRGDDDYDTINIINSLESLGLVNKDYFIFCRKSNQQISKVNSLDAIEDARSHGFRCFACGNLLSEEKISPQVRTSALGAEFARPNYWLALHVAKSVRDLGFADRDILQNTEKDNQVFDLFISSLKRFVMIEVRDTPPRLEEIFMFLTRASFYKPFRAILVCSGPVGLDVKMYLSSFGNLPVSLVEGLDKLEDVLRSSYDQIKLDYLMAIFTEFREETGIPLSGYIIEKLYGLYEEPQEEDEIHLGIMSTRHVSSFPGDDEPYGKIEEFTEVIPTEELDYIEAVEEVIPEAMETTEMEAAITTEMTLPDEMDSPLIEDEYVMAGEPGELEESGGMEDFSAPEAEEGNVQEMTDDFAMDFAEALPDEILPAQEIPSSQDGIEEIMEKTANCILDFVRDEGVPGNIHQLEGELQAVNEIGLYGGILADSSGLVIASTFDVNAEPDFTTGYGTAIFQSINDLITEVGFPDVFWVHLEGSQGRIRVFHRNGYYLIAREDVTAGEYEEEGEALPGERSLREAIMKKVLDDLSRTDKVVGSLLSGMDGLVIETNLPDHMDNDSLGYISSQFFGDNHRFMEKLGIGHIGQVLLKTGETTYSLIPIGKEAILTTCLEPGASRETWLARLPQAGQMLVSVLSE